MADNVELASGSGGATVKTDDDGTAHWQYVKIAYGADNTQTRVTTSAPLPVDLRTDNLAGNIDVNIAAQTSDITIADGGNSITIDGTVTANLSATDNAVLDNIDTNTAAIVATEGSALGSGVLLQGDDGTDRKNINVDATTGDVQVDVTNTVTVSGTVTSDAGTGTFTVGGVAAENAAVSGNPVLAGGRYDSSPRTLGDGDVGAVALDADGAVQISDGGNSITVDNSDITTIAGAVSGSEMQVDVVAALPAGTNAIGKLAANSGVDIGDVDVTSISAGTNLIGDVGISGARTSGGTTIYRNLDVDESEDEIKGTAGQLYWLHAMNMTASPIYLKFYNATAASVTVGTTTPVLTFAVPTAGDTNGAGFNFAVPNGVAFGTAITVACTTALADADTGAPGANAMVINLGYA
jgi:hypothetical protein